MFEEEGTRDITAETVFDAVSVLEILPGLFKLLSRGAIFYTEEQAAKRVVKFSQKQLQKKYMRHAAELGLKENYNLKNAEKFAKMVESHIKDPSTKLIKGTFRGKQKVNIYYNEKTRLLVMTKRGDLEPNQFISAWKYSIDQYKHLIHGGNIQ